MNSRTNSATRILTFVALTGTSCVLSWFLVVSPLLDMGSAAIKLVGKLLAGA